MEPQVPIAPTFQTPEPTETPRVLTSMGSVFGTELTGFALVNEQSPAQPTTADRRPAVMPTDVLTQDVATLQSDVRSLRFDLDQAREEIRALSREHEDLKRYVMNLVKPPEPLIVTSKKMGRPKKV